MRSQLQIIYNIWQLSVDMNRKYRPNGKVSSKNLNSCFKMCKIRQGITFLPHPVYEAGENGRNPNCIGEGFELYTIHNWPMLPCNRMPTALWAAAYNVRCQRKPRLANNVKDLRYATEEKKNDESVTFGVACVIQAGAYIDHTAELPSRRRFLQRVSICRALY